MANNWGADIVVPANYNTVTVVNAVIHDIDADSPMEYGTGDAVVMSTSNAIRTKPSSGQLYPLF